MSIVKSYKFGAVSTSGNDNTSFNYTKEETDVLGFSNSYSTKEGVALSTWVPNLLILDETFETIKASSKNTVYVDTTHVKKVNGSTGAVSSCELSPTYVTQTDCILKFTWSETSNPTTIEAAKFFAYNLDLNDLDSAPTGVTVVGFEHTGSAIRKNRVGDATGKAWNSSYGIGGRAYALSLATQMSALEHSFYLGFSLRPNSYGNSTFGFCIEFDVS